MPSISLWYRTEILAFSVSDTLKITLNFHSHFSACIFQFPLLFKCSFAILPRLRYSSLEQPAKRVRFKAKMHLLYPFMGRQHFNLELCYAPPDEHIILALTMRSGYLWVLVFCNLRYTTSFRQAEVWRTSTYKHQVTTNSGDWPTCLDWWDHRGILPWYYSFLPCSLVLL